ncbi:MAG: CapA family protein [Symbiobacteriaceae bacterium]|nr:CapA family protein [Symbiobacteriaceae bacterium]
MLHLWLILTLLLAGCSPSVSPPEPTLIDGGYPPPNPGRFSRQSPPALTGAPLLRPGSRGGVVAHMYHTLGKHSSWSSTLPATEAQVATAAEAPVAEAPTPEPLRLKLVAVGDNLIHYPIYEQAYDLTSDSYNFTASYAPVRELFAAADIAFLNQEVPTAGREFGLSSYPLFNSPWELARDMVEFLGVDVVNLATNHVIDKGLGGFLATKTYWQEYGALPIGVWHLEEEHGVRLLTCEGVSMAFVGYSYSLNGLDLVDWQGWQVGRIQNREEITRDIIWGKEHADLVVVSCHWGDEGSLIPNREQQELAELCAALNVDLVLGHHPHVLQPLELLPRADGGLLPVYYSLGNFISNQIEAENMLGGMATLDIIADTEGIRLANPRLVPLVTHFTPGFRYTYIYPLEEYTAELAANHGIRAYDSRFSLPWLWSLYERLITPPPSTSSPR